MNDFWLFPVRYHRGKLFEPTTRQNYGGTGGTEEELNESRTIRESTSYLSGPPKSTLLTRSARSDPFQFGNIVVKLGSSFVWYVAEIGSEAGPENPKIFR